MDKELKKQLKKLFRLLSKYPNFVQFYKEFTAPRQLFNFAGILNPSISKRSGRAVIIDDVQKLTDIFDRAEKEIRRKETQKEYEMPTFAFDADDILEHCRKMDGVKERLVYLQFIHREYPNHLKMRYEIISNHISGKLRRKPDFANQLIEHTLPALRENQRDLEEFTKPLTEQTFMEKMFDEYNRLVKILIGKKDFQPAVELVEGKEETQRPEPAVAEESGEGDDMITIEEVCDLLDCSVPTVYNLRKRGLFEGYPAGRRTLYKKSEVLAAKNKRGRRGRG